MGAMSTAKGDRVVNLAYLVGSAHAPHVASSFRQSVLNIISDTHRDVGLIGQPR
jgi:hypothetical protein